MASLQTARSVEMEQEAKITAMKQELKERDAQMMQNALQSENMVCFYVFLHVMYDIL